jgi:hypothetical protein
LGASTTPASVHVGLEQSPVTLSAGASLGSGAVETAPASQAGVTQSPATSSVGASSAGASITAPVSEHAGALQSPVVASGGASAASGAVTVLPSPSQTRCWQSPSSSSPTTSPCATSVKAHMPSTHSPRTHGLSLVVHASSEPHSMVSGRSRICAQPVRPTKSIDRLRFTMFVMCILFPRVSDGAHPKGGRCHGPSRPSRREPSSGEEGAVGREPGAPPSVVRARSTTPPASPRAARRLQSTSDAPLTRESAVAKFGDASIHRGVEAGRKPAM